MCTSDWHVSLVGLADSFVDGSLGDHVLRTHLLVAHLICVDGSVDVVLGTSGLLAEWTVLADHFTDRDLDDVVVVGARLLAERSFFNSDVSDRGLGDGDLVLTTSTGDVGLRSHGALGVDNLVALLRLLGDSVGIGDLHSSVDDDLLLYNTTSTDTLDVSGSTTTPDVATTSISTATADVSTTTNVSTTADVATTSTSASATTTATTDVATATTDVATASTDVATAATTSAATASTVSADAGTSERSLKKRNTC